MFTAKLVSMCASIIITAGGFFVTAPPVRAAEHPLYVIAPDQLILVRRISYADLNLGQPAGEVTLNHRVNGAVGSLCNEAAGGDDGSLTTNAWRMRCDTQAWEQARPQVQAAVQQARGIASIAPTVLTATAITISLPR